MRTGGGYGLCRPHDLPFVLYRARTGHDGEFIAADFMPTDTDLGFVWAKFLADEFVRRRNPDRFLDTGHCLDGFEACRYIAHPDDTDYNSFLALNRVDLV